MALQRFVVVLFILLFVSISVHASTIHVKANGLDTSDGLTWETAKKTVTAALTAAVAGDEIWVAKGTYVERLRLKNGVDLYGGFSGSETERSQRNWTTNTTTLDGSQAGSVVTAVLLTSGRIDGFTVRNGKTTSSGGGITCVVSTVTVANCIITANTAKYGGGFHGTGSCTLINCLVYKNNATERGGGVYCGQSTPPASVVNNTIVANTAPIEGGGICCNDSSPLIINNIICFNSSGIAKQVTTGAPVLKNNCIYNPDGLNYSNISAGTGDISLDPLFESLYFAKFHIQPESPCIDTGDDSAFVPDSVDMDGQPRKIGDHIDIGADESDGTEWKLEPKTIRVRTDGNDSNDGSSWSLAKKTVSAAITSASESGGEVWVAAGTYYERITLMTGVYLYGGFAGTENARDERDWKKNTTTLNANKLGTVVYSAALGILTTALDGFDVTGGFSSAWCGGIECSSARISNNNIYGNVTTGQYQGGGGISCNRNSIVTNNIISGNRTEYAGGGIYASSGSVISGNTITNNQAYYGAGIYCYNSVISNNIISANTAVDMGGGVYAKECKDISGNTMEGNSAKKGAAIYCTGNSTNPTALTISNSTFKANKASVKAAIYLQYTSPTITGNIITENEGGGIYSYGADNLASVTITDNQITANTTTQGSAGAYFEGCGSLTLKRNNLIDNNVVTTYSDTNNCGGFRCVNTTNTDISDNVIQGNISVGGTAGIDCSSASTSVIRNNRITGNKLWTKGVGSIVYLAIRCGSSSPMVSDNYVAENSLLDTPASLTSVVSIAVYGADKAIIADNTVFPGDSDGLFCVLESGSVLRNTVSGSKQSGIHCYGSSCTIANNVVNANRQGIYSEASSAIITNNTVTANSIYGIYFKNSPTIANNIISFNTTGLYTYTSGTPLIKNNCVFNPGGTNYQNVPVGSGDISADPRLESFEYGKIHLQPDSPCINAGDSSATQPDWLDIDGMSRIAGENVDIGADEADGEIHSYKPPVAYVTLSGDDANDGSSWQKAKRSIQSAINAMALSSGQVWVKRGVYEEQITLLPYVHLYGGFAGTEDSLSLRNWSINTTSIDAKNKGAVITALAAGRKVGSIDGFTITGGSTTGGILLEASSPRIANNRIINNLNSGIRCYLCYSDIINNYISGNQTSLYGGGIYVNAPSSPRIVNNIISRNTSAVRGGGIHAESETAVINNTITENTSVYGGGVSSYFHKGPVFNNVIAFNSSGIHGTNLSTNYNCLYNPEGKDYDQAYPGKYDISADPLFVNRTAQDYHLQKTSPCINKGWNDAPGLPSIDMDGQARVMFGTVDMGADEYATARNIYEAKLADNGYRTEIDGAIVTAVFPGYFYIEGSDRSNGIRVEQIGHDLAVGSRASVTGTANESSNGERCITALTITTTGTGSIEALALNNRRIGGGMFGKQNGVWSWRYVRQPDKTLKLEWLPSVGLNNIGLLLRTCGKITYVGYGFFYLDDGSHNNDGSGHIGIKVYGTLPVTDGNVIGRFVYINGISSCEKSGEDLISVILTRNQQDVVLGD